MFVMQQKSTDDDERVAAASRDGNEPDGDPEYDTVE